ncbi:MAG: glycosyltransferase, partial [Mariprofundaceae bacterium]|nr:glycosyltransferase [Mariprofundaceae bacterium]
IEHAAHDLIVFVDDDCRVETDWLRRLVRPLDDPQLLGVQGGVTVPDDTNAIGWAETLLGFPGGGMARIHQSRGEIQETMEVSTLNAAYRKQAVINAGGFAAAARFGGEDYVLAKRVARQGRLLFVPSAFVRHAARGNFPAIWRWFVRRGTAETDLWRHNLATDGFGGWMIRSSVGLKLLCVLLLWPWFDFWPIVLLFTVYVMLAWWRMRWCLYKQTTGYAVPWTAFAIVPAVKLCMDLAADVGHLNRLLKRNNG